MFSNMDRRRWLFLALAFAMTFTVLFGFLLDSDFRKLGPGEQIIYVENWRANRSEAEIAARQRRDQAVQRQQEEERRRQYQKLGKSLGIERSEEHKSELQSLMRTSYAVFCLT